MIPRALAAALLTGALACGGERATQYVGSVMNDAAPDSAGSFMLTFVSHTDTSFGGIIELGPPMSGTSSAFAWHDGAELEVVTVGFAGSDTIVWRSRSTGADIGGRFEITGGARAGQGGTWRAHLTQGLPASPATLRRPASMPATPVTMLWPLIVLAAVIAAAARWVRRAPVRPPIVEQPDEVGSAAPPGRSLSGIGGWLSFFLFAQCVGLVIAIVSAAKIPADYAKGIAAAWIVTGLGPTLILESAVHTLIPFTLVLGIVLIVRRHRMAPRLWFAYMALSAVFLVLDLIIGRYLNADLGRRLGRGYVPEGGGSPVSVLRQVAVTLIWAWYWIRSERVRATFGAAALDATARPIAHRTEVRGPSIGVAGPRRRRLALRIAGAIVGALLLLFGVGLWTAWVRPYTPPPGSDIRRVVAGRWDWSYRTAPCTDSAHVIAFPDDGRVMTIVNQTPVVDSLGIDHTTTTYDIVSSTSGSIRGAIRGERRMTSEGKPVVWDLVLVGPDEYRWRRADWSSPWGYTGSIVRCSASAPRRAAAR